MNNFLALRTLYLSFYSRHAYIRAVKEWTGLSFGYLFMVVLFSTIAIGIWVHVWVNIGVQQLEKMVLPQLPKLIFKDSVLTIDKPLPYTIIINEEPFIRFAETDAQSADTNDFVPVIVGKTKWSQYAANGRVTQADFAQNLNTIIEPLGVAKYVTWIKTYLGLTVGLILLPLHFTFVAVQTLILGLVGKLFASTMTYELNYPDLVRVSTVSVTPGIIVGTLLLVNNQFFGLWLGIYGIMALAYLFYGVYSNKRFDELLAAAQAAASDTNPFNFDDPVTPLW